MNPKTSQDLFNKIRSQFSNIKIGDESGGATADPSQAVFFEFEFQPDSDTFGSVSVSIADGENMKVFYNRDLVDKIDEDSKDEWYAFLKEMKDFAVEHSLRFDVRDITKSNLTKQDYQNIADTNKTVNTDEMSEELARITELAGVNEGLTGTARRSYENLDKTRLIIRHTGSVDENVPGARSRQIQSLYIENEDGERFKYPLTHLAGARAMTRHVANGGRPHDEFGQHIIQTSEDIAKLNSFSRFVSNKDQLNDNAGDIIEQTKLKLENLREYMRNLSKQGHYDTASKDFKTADEVVLDDETANTYKDKFTMKNLDSRVEDALPIIHRIMSEIEASDVVTIGKGTKNLEVVQAEYEILGTMEDMMAEGDSEQEVMEKIANFVKDEAGEDHVDKAMEIIKQAKENNDQEMTFEDMINKLKGKKEDQVNELEPGDEPIDAPIEPPVDHGGIVTSFLTDPENKLVLRKDPSADKLLTATKFKDKNTMLSSIMSDIAERMLTKTGEEDRIANFASRVADGLDQEKSAAFKPTPDYIKNKKIAIQLAKRYIDDYKKMQNDPKFADEIRMDPADYNPKKDIKGKAKETEQFESWVENIDKVEEDKGSTLASRIIRKAGMDDPESMDAEVFKKSADLLDAGDLEEFGKYLYKQDTSPREFVMKKLADHDPETFKKVYGDQEGYLATMKPMAASKAAEDEFPDTRNNPLNPFDKDLDDKKAKLKALQDIQMDKNTSKDPELQKELMKRKAELTKEEPAFAGEQVTFEDIKPYVSMYKGDDGKTVNAVLDKDGKEVFKTGDAKEAMRYLSKNFDKLKNPVKESNPELDRIKSLSFYQ